MQQMNDQTKPTFSIEKIYVKDLSLENPGSPQSFLSQQTAPQVDVSLQTRGEPVANDLYEVVLTLTVSAKVGDATLFLVEASQAGLFTMRNVPEADIKPLLGLTCPNILFPYARETIADAISRSGFPPIHLDPINFETLYQQQVQQQGLQPMGAAPVPGITTPAAN
jgi:preprotein translocase subunit SecB